MQMAPSILRRTGLRGPEAFPAFQRVKTQALPAWQFLVSWFPASTSWLCSLRGGAFQLLPSQPPEKEAGGACHAALRR
jgi:hypothetical protein